MKKNGFAEILSHMSRTADRKAAAKLPSLQGIRIPTGLALEQCSSEATARHKAAIAVNLANGRSGQVRDSVRLADLTGGLGIDCWAFSSVFSTVLHNEMNPALSEAVRENFKTLGIGNVKFCGHEVRAGSDEWESALASFKPDIIYLDPARRDASGRKVFLIEDCSPNILELLPSLLSLSSVILLKLSPMADISLVAKRISDKCREHTGHSCLKEIQVVGLDGECKELLCVIDREWDGVLTVGAVTLGQDGGVIAEYGRTVSTDDSPPCRIAEADEPAAGNFLLCPGAVLLKTGLQDRLCEYGNISKLDRFTQLFICNGEIPDIAGRFCSIYRISEVLPFCNRTFKDLGTRLPGMDVTARNLPVTSEELKMRIFGRKNARCDRNGHIWGFSTPYGRFLAVCNRIQK